MTRREAIEILSPQRVSVDYTGGVCGCPSETVFYNERVFNFDMSLFEPCPGDCARCWDEKLSINESVNLLSVVGDGVIREFLRVRRNEPVQK